MTPRAWFVAIQSVMTAAFVFSVAVQYNDPDPLPWMGIYGAAAVASAWAALRPRGYPWPFPAAVGTVALVWSFFLLPQVVGKVRLAELFASWEMKSPRVEVAREAGGLLIVAAWMAVTASIRRMIPG
jgi:Transmembrane family 220, helix